MPGTPLQDRVALITGASSGIGEAAAIQLAGGGASVVIAARRANRLEALRRRIEADGGTALAVPTDVTSRASVDTLARQTLERFDRIDMLINNAGVMPLSPIATRDVEAWDRMLDVNVRGLLYCIAAVLPGMLERRDGHIVNVGSLAGRRPFPGGTVYSATKFAVRAISAGLRLELSPEDHIRVTDIEPGVVATELTGHIPDESIRDQFHATWSERTPLAPDDVARAILFAVSQPWHVNVNEILIRPTEQGT